MAVREILQLGNPQLYGISEPVEEAEFDSLAAVIEDLRDTLLDFRRRYGTGRAIAAPQIGVMKRLVFMQIDEPKVFVNPELSQTSGQIMEVWDDCMSFPELLVKVRRHLRCTITYRDTDRQKKVERLEGDLSELLQHECDHLDGILVVSRAVDAKAFSMRSQQQYLV